MHNLRYKTVSVLRDAAGLLLLCGLLLLHNGSRAQAFQLPGGEPIRYLALGDSYTIGQSVSVDERWPEQLRDSLEAAGYSFDTLNIIASTGWTTGSLLSAVASRRPGEENYNLVSLLIGVNNQFQGGSLSLFSDQFNQLLDSAIVYAGGNQQRVFVLSIPDYYYTPVGQVFSGGSEQIDQFNLASRVICGARGIAYYDITGISRNEDEVMVASDGLHPSGYQYSLWVQRIMQSVPRLVTAVDETVGAPPMRLYPVPAAERIYLSGLARPDGAKQRIDIVHTASGRTVHTVDVQPLPGAAIAIDLPDNLAPGAYQAIAIHAGHPAVARPFTLIR
jgi:lysophospholipase L1-like esterase